MTLLAVRHASLGYSRHPVLRDVSFTLSQGTICCLLGANGCGKTTLMRSILGVIPLLKGEILLDSLSVQTLSHRQRAQAIGARRYFCFQCAGYGVDGPGPHHRRFFRSR